jgi:AcrR family transcriptional regulator
MIRPMGRWKPGAQGRLEQAAFELYADRGFENTTVSDIAERAGLTERTFFRYFADKREVLFSGADALRDAMVSAVEDAPAFVAPIDAAAEGLDAVAALLPDPEIARKRQAIIAANSELQERELIKLASLADALAVALAGRGVNDASARLTAEIGIGVFRAAFQRWVGEPNRRGLAELIQESLDEARALVGESSQAPSAAAQA